MVARSRAPFGQAPGDRRDGSDGGPKPAWPQHRHLHRARQTAAAGRRRRPCSDDPPVFPAAHQRASGLGNGNSGILSATCAPRQGCRPAARLPRQPAINLRDGGGDAYPPLPSKARQWTCPLARASLPSPSIQHVRDRKADGAGDQQGYERLFGGIPRQGGHVVDLDRRRLEGAPTYRPEGMSDWSETGPTLTHSTGTIGCPRISADDRTQAARCRHRSRAPAMPARLTVPTRQAVAGEGAADQTLCRLGEGR